MTDHDRELGSSSEETDRITGDRERLADQREQIADDRDRIADDRERIADGRERIADAREQTADQREDTSDARERSLDEHEARTDESTPAEPASAEDSERRHQAAIERGRARQAAIAARIQRNEALVRRVKADADRQRADHARTIAALERAGIGSGRQPGLAISPSASMLRETRRRLVESALDLAEVEDTICRVQEGFMSAHPDKAREHRRLAEQAGAGAERARAIARAFSD